MVNLSDTDMKLVNENQQILNSLGIFMEQGGPESIRIRNIPALLEQADILSLITDLLQILAQPNQGERQDLLIKTMAKHVNDGMYQSPGQNEVKEMLHKIELLEIELNPAEFSKIFRFMDKQTIMKILGG